CGLYVSLYASCTLPPYKFSMRILRFGLPALAALLAAVVAPATASAAYSDPLTTTTKQGLVWHATPAAALTALDNALPNVSANTVVNDTTYTMTGCSSAEKAALPKAPTASAAVCWDPAGGRTAPWVPQGLAPAGAADDGGL